MSTPLPSIPTENNYEDLDISDLPPLPKRKDPVPDETSNGNEELQEVARSNQLEMNENAMDPDHPLLERVQKAINDQLTAHLEALELDLRVKQEGADREMKRREDAGVQLYNLQQHLAKLQASYEASEENFGVMKGLRADAERVLLLAKTEYEAGRERVASHTKNLDSHQAELERIQSTLRQVDMYKEELRSKILVAKRTTLKTEKDLAKKEIEKKRQDYHIEKLTEQLKKLQNQKSAYDSQIENQKRETQAAMKMLREATTEMEAIQFEKRQLLNQWNSSLLGLKKRDEMVASIKAEMAKNEQQLELMNNEITGLKRSMRQARTDGENLTAVLTKLESEIEYVTSQMDNSILEKEAMADKYQILEKTMAKTEEELSIVAREESKIRLEINSLKKLESQTVTQIQSLDQKLYEKLQFQSSLEMGASSTARDGMKLRAQIEDKQGEIISSQNEISSITLTSLDLANKVETLKTRLSQVDKSIDEKNTAIQNYDQDFKTISDQIKKKASQMDFLNKKLGSLTSEQVHTGPLEATIASLAKSISILETEQLDLQTRYLQVQTELVKTNGKCQAVDSEIDTLSLLKKSLVRQNTIIDSALRNESVEITTHSRNISALHLELSRVSSLLHSQGQIHSSLDSDTLILRSTLKEKLKEAEMTCLSLQANLEKLKEDKSKALDSIVEADRQYLMWDSKYSLAKEMSATLDPSTGSSELSQMSQEIYRMGLRYKSILALQERMVSEMEKGVYRRGEIAKRAGKGSKGDSLQKTIEGLKSKLKTGLAEIRGCERDIEDLKCSEENLQARIEQSRAASESYLQTEKELQNAVEILAARKRMYTNATLVYQKLHKRYRDLLDGKNTIPPDSKTYEEKMVELENAQGRLQKIAAVIQDLSEVVDLNLKSVMGEYSSFIRDTVVVL